MIMKKYLSLIKYEFKTILKEPMNVFLLFFPFLMLFIAGFLLPAILNRAADPDSPAARISLLIAFVTILGIGGYMSGLLLGFSLLDNRDEKTLLNIAVSPVTVSGYTTFKIVYSLVIGFLSNLVLLGGLILVAKDEYVIMTGLGTRIGLLDGLGWGEILVFSAVSSLFGPMIALVLSMIAKNKIEGFALMKTGGIIIMIPALSLLPAFQDWKQYLLGIVPIFWPVKALLNLSLGSMNSADLGFWGYMIIGVLYEVLVCVLCFRLFIKKNEVN
jgi:fluoroquinolone transport system permease protein